MARVTPLTEEVNNLLASHGFARSRRTWNRKNQAFVDVVDIQSSGGATGEAITLNLGVFEREVYELVWRRTPPEPIKEYFCIARSRLGYLIDGKDFWWSRADPHTPKDVAAKLQSFALPFFESLRSCSAMLQFLESGPSGHKRYPPEALYIAALKYKLGDVDGARELIDQLRTRMHGDWLERLDGLSASIGSRDRFAPSGG